MSTPTPPPGPGSAHGATPIGARDERGRKKKGLLWGALALLALVAIALLLSQCGGDDPTTGTDAAEGDRSSSSSASPSSSADASESSDADGSGAAGSSASGSAGGSGGGAAGGAGGGGELVVGEQSLLEIVANGGAGGESPSTVLAELAGQDATATGVQVLSVPADEGFWVGSSDAQRVWVQLVGGEGESPYQVEEGDTVDFEGVLVPHDETFASEVGVDEASGAAQLTEQGHHVEVEKSAVQLSE